MDQRRLLSFILASTAFFFFYLVLLKNFGVQPNPNAAQNAAALDGDDPNVGDVEPDDVAGDAADDSDSDASTPAVEGETDGESDNLASKRPDRPQWITLGSMAKDSEHLMMVTLNSRGGGIERVELTTREEGGGFKYRRVDVRNGYLGYFAGETAEMVDGVLVNVVGPGTPAALATASNAPTGIQVGDIIVTVNSKSITAPEDIRDALAKTIPGDIVEVEVLRGANTPGGDNVATTPITFTATLSEHPLDLVRLARYGGEDQVVGNLSQLSCLLTLEHVNRKGIAAGDDRIKGLVDPTTLVWNSATADTPDGSKAIFDLELSSQEMKSVGGEAVRISRSYSLPPKSYVLDMTVQVENLGKKPQKLAYRLDGVNGVTMEGWWYSNKVSPSWSRAAARDIAYKTTFEGHELITGCNLLKRAQKTPEDSDQTIFAEDGDDSTRDLKYIGIDAQYFNCAYIPPEQSPESMANYFRRATATVVADPALVKRHQEHAVNASFYLDSVIANVPPKKALFHKFRLFAGPKETDLVPKYGLQDCVYYGWFAKFAKVLVWVLHMLNGIFNNYAVAIILLTIMVRAMMFPLSRKAAVNAQRMQELAPELKKIAEQYKDDMEGRLKAQRELQRRVGFNPMAGCLPMFLQLPIFIGLYRSLSVDIELRQSAVSSATNWASNLAGPDMLSRWDGWLMEYFSGRGTGWLGPYFNILPLFVVVLFLTQQKLFMPPATDEQTRMTQKMMGIMTLFMGLFFFRVPAGLCLYFIASSLWGICERILVKKTLPTQKHFEEGVIDGTATPTKKQSFADRIRDQMKPPEPDVVTPNKRKRPPKGKKNR